LTGAAGPQMIRLGGPWSLGAAKGVVELMPVTPVKRIFPPQGRLRVAGTATRARNHRASSDAQD